MELLEAEKCYHRRIKYSSRIFVVVEMDDLDETTIPFTIIDARVDTRVDTRVSDVRASRKAESWDEHASSKAFKSSCASHPDNGGVRQGFDVVPLVLETINMASTTLRDDDDEEEYEEEEDV